MNKNKDIKITKENIIKNIMQQKKLNNNKIIDDNDNDNDNKIY